MLSINYDLDIEKVFFVVRHDDAVVGFSNGGNDRIECASRAALRPTIGH